MTVNLSQHQADISRAYSSVIESTNGNWAVFGYEGNSNILKVVEEGDNDLDGLSMAFNAGKIMYGLCSLTDAASGMRRLVLVNWQGEGAPTGRLGLCASHLGELRKVFKGVHLVITARNEDDVEPDAILEQLKKCRTATAASAEPLTQQNGCGMKTGLSLKPPPKSPSHRQTPTGIGIDVTARDKFWEQAEREESLRLEEERRKKEEEDESYRAENHRLQDQISRKFHEAAEPLANNSSANVHQQQSPQVPSYASNSNHNTRASPSSTSAGGNNSSAMHANIRRMWQEKEESGAAPVVPQQQSNNRSAVQSARALHEKRIDEERQQDQSAYHSNSRTHVSHPTAPPPAPTAVLPTPASSQPPPALYQNVPDPEPYQSSHPDSYHSQQQQQPAPVAEPPRSMAAFASQLPRRPPSSSEEDERDDWDEPDPEDHSLSDPMAALSIGPEQQQQQQHNRRSDPADGVCAQAIYDYQAADIDEITFNPGDVITRIEVIDDGWWQGMAPDGTFGLFPSNYVQRL